MRETSGHEPHIKRSAREHPLRVAFEFAAWTVLICVLSLAFALAVISPAFASVNAQAKGGNETGFARLVIKFDRMPSYSDKVASGVLILTFDEQVNVDLREIPDQVPDYIGIARRDPDGRALRLAMQRPFRVNVMEAGKRLFIDLLPPNWIGAPPPLPKDVMRELSRQALAAERKALEEAKQRAAAKDAYKVDVRLARHPTFSRVVFDWNKFVTASMARQGSTVTLEFGQQAEPDLSGLKVDPPKYLRGAQAKQTPGGLVVELTVDGDVDVRGFREGNGYTLDLTGPDDADLGAGEAAARAVPRPEKSAQASEEIKLAGAERQTSEKRKDAPAKVETQVKAMDMAALGDEALGDGDAALPPEPGEKLKSEDSQAETVEAEAKREDDAEPEPDTEASASQPQTRTEETPAEQTSNEEPQVARNEAERSVADELKPAQQDDGEDAAAEPAKDAAVDLPSEPQRGDEAAPGEAMTQVQLRDTDSILRVTIPFSQPTPSTVFRRGQSIWLVFDNTDKLDISALEEAKGDKIVDVENVRGAAMQYIRLGLARPWLAYAKSKGTNWVVSIGDMVTGETKPLALKRTLREDSQSLIRIALKDAGRVHWIDDPVIGDRLAVVTALAPARGLTKPQDLVDFTALRTAHGLAIRPNSDDVGVRLALEEVVITRHAGLTLSAGGAHQYVPGKKALENTSRHGYVDFKAWRVVDRDRLSGRAAQLQRSIALSPDEEKNGLRFALARLYIANDLITESLGVLNQMVTEDKAVAMDPSFNATRGAALALLGRIGEARKDLSVHALANDADARLWRAYCDAKEKIWERALQGFYESWNAAKAYPDNIQARFWLAAARAALALSQLERAADALEALPQRQLASALEAETHVIRGRYLNEIGRHEEAMQAFEAALESPHRASATEAELSIIEAKLKAASIDQEAAIKQLERLQIVWRGDDIELGTLQLLSDLYVKKERWHDAFAVMESAMRAFPEATEARRIQDGMRLVFQDLFLHGESEKLRPIDALSLFYDYRELTPVGRLGDDMIRKLADRLISVDLLDQASDILGHQVEKRLRGAARAQVATRLAMVHLLNRKPGLAIRVLRRTRQAGLPESMKRNRSLLEARALGELGRAEAAIEILDTLKGDDIERLKGDALWTSRQWKKAGEQIERYLGLRWQKAEALDERERKDVLRAAISYSLADDQFALDRMRKKFYDKMLKTSDAESFLLVTKPTKVKSNDFRALAKEIAATDTLDAFMKEFRESYERDTSSLQEAADAATDAG